MGFARLALYIAGLIVVVMAAWVFLTQTPIADDVPVGVSLAVILLLVGIGVMAGARAMDDTFSYSRRTLRDSSGGAPGGVVTQPGTYVPPSTTYVPPTSGHNETVVEERRY